MWRKLWRVTMNGKDKISTRSLLKILCIALSPLFHLALLYFVASLLYSSAGYSKAISPNQMRSYQYLFIFLHLLISVFIFALNTLTRSTNCKKFTHSTRLESMLYYGYIAIPIIGLMAIIADFNIYTIIPSIIGPTVKIAFIIMVPTISPIIGVVLCMSALLYILCALYCIIFIRPIDK